MDLLDVGLQELMQYEDAPEKNTMSEMMLLFLKLLSVVADKEADFMFCVSECSRPLLVTNLHVLLQMCSPKTLQPDYVTTLSSYLIFNRWLPSHCLYVVRLIRYLSSNIPKARLLNYFVSSRIVSRNTLFGFSSCLELDEVDAVVDSEISQDIEDIPVDSHAVARIRGLLALEIIEMLCECFRPFYDHTCNLGHFLCGFDFITTEQTVLQNPGVRNNQRTCLHCVLHILNSALGEDLRTLSFGMLVEPSYRLLYWLACGSMTSDPLLRYLRTVDDFIFRHTSQFPIEIFRKKGELDFSTLVMHDCLGWIMKLCAVELKCLLDGGQKSQSDRFFPLLTELECEGGDILPYTGAQPEEAGSLALADDNYEYHTEPRLLAFLDPSVIAESTFSPVSLKYFNGTKLSQLIAACTLPTTKGYMQCDVSRLHDLLSSETSCLKSVGMEDQIQEVTKESDAILQSVAVYNRCQQTNYVRRMCFDGWRQLAEVIFLSLSIENCSTQRQISFVTTLINRLLSKDLSGLYVPLAKVLFIMVVAIQKLTISGTEVPPISLLSMLGEDDTLATAKSGITVTFPFLESFSVPLTTDFNGRLLCKAWQRILMTLIKPGRSFIFSRQRLFIRLSFSLTI
ncbi:unnamed protein product [Soboliphyme baturini]|uniref:Non-specific serine/threonine protein kinase n=1 Tax=Soboliphyme baturini TaxID=241478 RepID=A0A183IXN3_9BILA|nr:unnamed protein product [Soboliphyme baturini]